MHAALAAWEEYVNTADGLPLLIQCALQHVQFESIHPYWDGNGRVGRLLIPLFLISKGRLSQPLLYLSAYIEEHRQDYYALLQSVRTKSEWRPWIAFFLTGVIEIAGQAGRQAAALTDLRENYRARLSGKTQPLRLIDHLFENPYITVSRARRLLDVSQPTARSAILTLQHEGVLAESSARAWGRTYLAREILRAIDIPEPPAANQPRVETNPVPAT
jgi:Fic family protein